MEIHGQIYGNTLMKMQLHWWRGDSISLKVSIKHLFNICISVLREWILEVREVKSEMKICSRSSSWQWVEVGAVANE